MKVKKSSEIYGHLALSKLGQILAIDASIGNAARRVFMVLAGYADFRYLSCHPSVATLAKALGISRAAVTKQICILEGHGYLRRVPRYEYHNGRKSNLIIFNKDLANEFHKSPDIFSKENLTGLLAYHATLLSYRATQPLEFMEGATSGGGININNKTEINKKNKQNCPKSNHEDLVKIKVRANSWEQRQQWQSETGIKKEDLTELEMLNQELRKYRTKSQMVDLGLAARQVVKNLSHVEKMQETKRLVREELKKAQAEADDKKPELKPE